MNTTPVEHVYVHVPFCSRRCSYCDFSIAVRRDVPTDKYSIAVASEAGVRAAVPAPGGVRTLYFGGGTPSKLGPAGVKKLVAALAGVGIVPRPDAEFTLEANPEDATAEAAEGWLEAGVNRVSVGIQSFDEGVLTWMHRTHSAADAARAIRDLRSAGFADISLDLIYALPARLARDWPADLDRAIETGADHMSVYGLTVEPRTPLGRWTARGAEVAQSDEVAAEEFLDAHERLGAAGYEHYEVSSHARPGKRSRHNSAYWRRVPYLGLGPSAHSFDGSARRWNVAAYADWEARLGAGEDPVGGTETITASQHAAERAYLALRTAEGFEFESPANIARAEGWIRAGWARHVPGSVRVALTAEGWLRLDALVASLDEEGR